MAVSSVTGLIDIALCCLLVARTSLVDAVVWGVLGALAFGLVTVVLVRLKPVIGDGTETSGEPDLAERLEEFERSIDEEPDGPADPVLVRWFWNGVLAVGFALFTVAVFVLGHIRTFLTVAIFTATVPEPFVWGACAAFAVAVAAHLLIAQFVTAPVARRFGLAG